MAEANTAVRGNVRAEDTQQWLDMACDETMIEDRMSTIIVFGQNTTIRRV